MLWIITHTFWQSHWSNISRKCKVSYNIDCCIKLTELVKFYGDIGKKTSGEVICNKNDKSHGARMGWNAENKNVFRGVCIGGRRESYEKRERHDILLSIVPWIVRIFLGVRNERGKKKMLETTRLLRLETCQLRGDSKLKYWVSHVRCFLTVTYVCNHSFSHQPRLREEIMGPGRGEGKKRK